MLECQPGELGAEGGPGLDVWSHRSREQQAEWGLALGEGGP